MTKKEAELAFEKGTLVPQEAFMGEPGKAKTKWAVKIISGPIPNLPRWYKQIQFSGTSLKLYGSNITMGYRWGWFLAQNVIWVTILNYSVMCGNGRLTKRIEDYVRTTYDPNVLIGKFYYKFWNKTRFMGYFTLTNVEE